MATNIGKKNIIMILALTGFFIVTVIVIMVLSGTFMRPETEKLEQDVMIELAQRSEDVRISQERLNELVQTLEEKRSQIDEHAAMIDAKEEKLKEFEKELLAKQQELQQLRESISTFVNKMSEVELDNVTKLAKVYEAMKPDQVSEIIEELENPIVVSLLTKMKTKSAAKILGYYAMLPDTGFERQYHARRAARLSEMIKKYQIELTGSEG